jgi:Secretion system C-terminal sorting domain
MKKIFLIFCFLLLFFPYSYSQYGWNSIIDHGHSYVNGEPVRALYNDVGSHQLLIGAKYGMFLSDTSGGACCSRCDYDYNGNIFNVLGCGDPIELIGSGTDTSCVMCFASVWDSTMSQDFYAIGGRFTNEWCLSPGTPTDFTNVVIIPADESYLYGSFMSCSDTVFAVAMLDNKKMDSCASEFKTYVAAKCTFCDCQVPSSIDSSRYIAFYDPYQGCDFTATVNYMQGGTNGPVYSIRAIDTANVYVGGRFDSAGVIKANNIAKWNGIGWDSLGCGINGVVKTLHTYNGKLYAGGNFTMAGGNATNNIAAWDGTNWSALGTGTTGMVNALAVFNGNLYAGGRFDSAGIIKANNIAKWDGTNWSAVAGGRNDEVYALATFQGSLYAGGKFLGGTNDTARYLAKYIDSTYVGISENSKPKVGIAVYPDPANDNITIESTAFTKDQIISVYDIQGQLLMRQPVLQAKTNIDISGMATGVYFVKVKTEKGFSVKKFIKE